MADLLNAADLLLLRREWVDDLIDLRPEWGSAPTVRTNASAGAASLAIQSLGSGTIARGTAFWVVTAAGRRDSYTVTADATIAAGVATVSISPLLSTAAAASDTIEVVQVYQSVFNRQTRRLFFSDTTLQDFAERAQETFGERIASSDDPKRSLFRAIRIFAREAKLADGSEFVQALIGADPTRGGAPEIDRMMKGLDYDRSQLETKKTGPAVGWLYK